MKTVSAITLDPGEIAVEIQNGREDLYLSLWESVRPFARKLSRAWAFITSRSAGERYTDEELEDLMQSAFIALYDAVPKYDPDRGGFLTMYKWYVKRAFRRYSGRPISTKAPDPIFTAKSLDAPISPDDPDGGTLAETIPDKTAGSHTEQTEQKIFDEGLRERVTALLARLPEESVARLRRVYWKNDPVSRIAEDLGLTSKQVYSRLEADYKRLRHALRRTPEGLEIRRYIEGATDYYLHFPAATQRRPVEELAIKREDLFSEYAGYFRDELNLYGRILTAEELKTRLENLPHERRISSIRQHGREEDPTAGQNFRHELSPASGDS